MISGKYRPGNSGQKNFPKTDSSGRRYATVPCHALQARQKRPDRHEVEKYQPAAGRQHSAPPPRNSKDWMRPALWCGRKNMVPRIKKYADEHEGCKIQDVWTNFKRDPQYPALSHRKNMEMLEAGIVRQSSRPDRWSWTASAAREPFWPREYATAGA